MTIEYDRLKCCGCGGCSDICPRDAISMIADKHGFLYPVVNIEKCIECGQCEKICAFNSNHGNSKHLGETFYLQHNDNDVIYNSSSGGAFTAISDLILELGGKIYGAIINTETFDVVHTCATTKDERNAMRGSKYVQSCTTGVFKKIKEELENGELVLFSGTPCQCAELVSFLGKPFTKLYIVDLFCHGVPSNKLFKDHIQYWENKVGKKALDYSFRSKLYGYEYTHSITFSDGSINSSIELKRYLKLFEKNMRDCCYVCPYASKERFGDITIADFWEASKVVGVSDHRGVSLIAANSEKGLWLLERMKKSSTILNVDISSLEPGAINKPVDRTAIVDEFWADYDEKGYEFVLNKYAKQTIKSTVYQILLRVCHRLGLKKIASKL